MYAIRSYYGQNPWGLWTSAQHTATGMLGQSAYKMTVEQAAEAVRTFQPAIVYPYHYRGSDVEEFRRRSYNFV